MSSLTYYAEHLAWQQRVKQERNRTSRFYQTLGDFQVIDSSTVGTKPIPTKPLVDENPINYQVLKNSLRYSYGEAKPIRYSIYDSPLKQSISKSPQKLREKVREASQNIAPYIKEFRRELSETKRNFQYGSSLNNNIAYVKTLEEKLIHERKERLKAEMKLNH